MNLVERLAAFFVLVRRFEGLRLKAYRCPAGIWTIGYGATGLGIGPGLVWTIEQAEARLAKDATRFAAGVLAICPNLADEPDERYSAIVDFAFNCGLGNLRASTLRKRVRAGDWPRAVREIKRWNRGGGKVLPGLVLRRAAEAELLA